MTARLRVLMVDDEAAGYGPLVEGLRKRGVETLTETLASRTLSRLAAEPGIDVVLLDLVFMDQGMQGDEVFAELRRRHPLLPVVILTSKDQLSLARSFEARGAAAYLIKGAAGLDVEEIAAHLDRAWRAGALRQLLERGRVPGAGALIAASPAMAGALHSALQVAGRSGPVLISGECGTGKSAVARYIHENGRFPGALLVPVDAATCSRDRIEQELFGDSERAGVISLARDGTVLIEAVELLAPELQNRILRAILESQESSSGRAAHGTRILLTCSANPETPIENSLTPSLYYRLSQSHVSLPPLRERRADILPLALRFAERGTGARVVFGEEAVRTLEAHSYPGNLWELRSVVEGVMARTGGAMIEGTHLQFPGAASLRGHPALDHDAFAKSILDRHKSIYFVENMIDDRAEANAREDYVAVLRAMVRIYRERHGADPLLKNLAEVMAPTRPEEEANRCSAKLRRLGLCWRDVVDRASQDQR